GGNQAEDLLIQEEAVRAQVDVALLPDDLGDELRQLRIDRRLAAADRDDGRLRDLDGLEALLQRQAIGKLPGVPLDGAAQAGQVAGVERLEHQHEWIALVAGEGIDDLVLDRARRDVQRKPHRFASPSRASLPEAVSTPFG